MKAARESDTLIHKSMWLQMTANFLETMEAKNEGMLKGKACPVRMLYLIKISLKTRSENAFSDKQKLSETITCSV